MYHSSPYITNNCVLNFENPKCSYIQEHTGTWYVLSFLSPTQPSVRAESLPWRKTALPFAFVSRSLEGTNRISETTCCPYASTPGTHAMFVFFHPGETRSVDTDHDTCCICKHTGGRDLPLPPTYLDASCDRGSLYFSEAPVPSHKV